MLFAGLQGKNKRSAAGTVCSGSDNSSGQFSHESALAAQIAKPRSTIVHGHAKRLSLAASDISAPFTRRAKHAQGCGMAVDDKKSLIGVAKLGEALEVFYDTVIVG